MLKLGRGSLTTDWGGHASSQYSTRTQTPSQTCFQEVSKILIIVRHRKHRAPCQVMILPKPASGPLAIDALLHSSVADP